MDESVQLALDIARGLIDAGIPVFACPPCPSGPYGPENYGPEKRLCPRAGHGDGAQEYDLPARWQLTVPSRVWLERWRPGWALAAVGGAAADFLDEDPRSRGDASVGELHASGEWPATFGEQSTPSGGRHYVIAPLAERKATGFLPGLDYQGGLPTDGKGGGGQGRGFVWIAPTVKRSKIDGTSHAYVWTVPPDLIGLKAAAPDERIRTRILAGQSKVPHGVPSSPATSSGGLLFSPGAGAPVGEVRRFTLEQAKAFCDITLERVRTAQIGRIEEETNAAACVLSRFVPEFFTADQAYAVLISALADTAYDPDGPHSGWTAEKFHDVLIGQGGRAPGDWVAQRVIETRAEAASLVTPDAVDALIAEMIEPDELVKRRPPRHVIRGLLTFDSESWIIGAPGSKKSFVALDMAAHVAAGRDWQGSRVQQARVVVIAAEGAGGIGKRLDAWQRAHEGVVLPPGSLRVLPRPVQAKDAGAWAVLVAACARLQAQFIVIDTQARVTVGLEENSATDIGVYLDAARALREATGACVLTVHHTGRKGGDARGSSAIDGAQDTELRIVPDGRELATLFTEKQKDIEPAEPLALKFATVDLGKDEEGARVDSLVLVDHDAWSAAAVDGQGLDAVAAEAAKDVLVFQLRAEPQEWTHRFVRHGAVGGLQRWLLQTLADAGGDVGLTETQWRDLVAIKAGALAGPRSTRKTVDSAVWRDAFKSITNSDHPARVAGIVCQVAGTKCWTVDPVALKALKTDTD